MQLIVDRLEAPPVDTQGVEIVERKGIGHPDTVCDALAERLSVSLSRFYRERFGLILHHNVDKALLWGGSARPSFGGGEVIHPIEIFLTGRAIREFKGVRVPVEDLALEGCQQWLRDNFHALDPEKHVKIHCLIRPGSEDLVELFLRQKKSGFWLANDSSCGVGYAPLSELETVVQQVERHLNAATMKETHAEIGEDIKVMGVRHGQEVHLTVACAFIGRHVSDVDDYVEKKACIAQLARQTAQRFTQREVGVDVNTADDPASGSVYLTVTGTSAEAGDDGEAGRGNRANGLITPYRPMTMESVAGKNPVTHVGKLYNVTAGLMAAAIVEEIREVTETACYLVSQIGRPIAEPQIVDVKIRTEEPGPVKDLNPRIEEIVRDHLGHIGSLWQDLVEGTLCLDQWPFRQRVPRPPQADRLQERQQMVREIEAEARQTVQWTGKSAFAAQVMAAMAKVPRHQFVPPAEETVAYVNGPLPIGYGQTISQPYIVALMTDLAHVTKDSVVLEVGTGSGYQAAVLAELVKQLYSLELVPELAEQARERLKRLGYTNIEVRTGDGYQGWDEHAPFDAIVVTAAAPEIPPALVAQLKRGGRMVIPVDVGYYGQELIVMLKDAEGEIEKRSILPVAFVPLRHGA